MARATLEYATAELHSMPKGSYKDLWMIVKIIHDNISMWTSSGEARRCRLQLVGLG